MFTPLTFTLWSEGRSPPGTNTHHRVLRLLHSPCGQRASWYQHTSPCFTPLTFTLWSEGLLVPTHITVFYASYIHLVVRGPAGTNTHHRVLRLLHSPCGQRVGRLLVPTLITVFYASYIHLVVRGPPGTNTHHRVLRLLHSPCGQRASWYQHTSPCFTPLTFTLWSEGLLVPTHITVFYASYIHLVVRGPAGTNTHHRVLRLLHSPCGQRASWYQHTSPCFTPLTFTLWSEGLLVPTHITVFYASYIHLVVRGPPGTNTHHRVLRLLHSPCGQRASWYQHTSPCFTPLSFTLWSECLLVPTHITVFYASYIHLVVRV